MTNPDAQLLRDKRADPRIIEALAAADGFELAVPRPAPGATHEEALAYCVAMEAAIIEGNEPLRAMLPVFPSLAQSTEIVIGVDGNQIKLFIYRPRETGGSVPCIVHTHRGGMVMTTAEDPVTVRWRTKSPISAWSRSVLGKSGGANLALATTLKAKREGLARADRRRVRDVSVHPGMLRRPSASLLSLAENEGYFMTCAQLALPAQVHDPTGVHAADSARVALSRAAVGPGGPSTARDLGQRVGPATRRGGRVLPQTGWCGVSAVGCTVHGHPMAATSPCQTSHPTYWRRHCALSRGSRSLFESGSWTGSAIPESPPSGVRQRGVRLGKETGGVHMPSLQPAPLNGIDQG